MSHALPPPCSACGGEIVSRVVPRPPSICRWCTSCGARSDEPLGPDDEAREILDGTARDRERLRAATEPARPLVLVWLPPGGPGREAYRDVAVMIRERLVADDPSVALKATPYPGSPDRLDDVTTGLADLSLLAAPDAAACRSALALVGEAIPTSRAIVFGTGLSPAEASSLAHPRLHVLEAGDAEPAGLFDAVSRTLSACRRVALWRALDPSAPDGDPLALCSSQESRIAAHIDDASVYLLRSILRRGELPRERLIEATGGGDALADRLEGLLSTGSVEVSGGAVRILERGRRILDRLHPPPDVVGESEDPLARLFREARAGNQDALGRILQAGGEEAHRIAHRRLGPALRAKVETVDITQSVIAELMKGIERFEFRSEPAWKGYLRRLVENKIRAKADYFGAARRDAKRDLSLDETVAGVRREIEAGSPSPSDALLREEEYGRLEDCLDRLPDAEREVLILRVFEGMSHREIARRLGRPSEGAIHKLYARALARLSSLMGGEG